VSCSIHNKLSVSHIQHWITFLEEPCITLEAILLAGMCHQGVAEAKYALMPPLPPFDAHAFFHPSVPSLPPPTTASTTIVVSAMTMLHFAYFLFPLHTVFLFLIPL